MFGHILVVDDDIDWRDFFYEVFTQANYQVTTFPLGQDIAELLKNKRPDYIILSMCRSSRGKEAAVLKNIRDVDKSIKVIVLADEKFDKEIIKTMPVDDRIVFLRKDTGKLQLLGYIFKILKEKDTEKIETQHSFMGRIMVIDDEAEVNSLIAGYLEKKGYDVVSVFNGEEAMVKIGLEKPQVVLLDIRMEGMDGMLLLRHIKQMDASIIVIMTSGIADEEVVSEAMKMGAAGYITKPFNLAKIEACILANVLLKKPREKSFTLVELMVAVSILSIGLIFVIRSFLAGMNVLDTSQNRINAVQLLQLKMSQLEEKAKAENGLLDESIQEEIALGGRSAVLKTEVVSLAPKEPKKEEETVTKTKDSLSEVKLTLLWKETGKEKDEVLAGYARTKQE